MSFGFMTPCWNCRRNIVEGCTDHQKMQEGINSIYKDTTTHKGSGNVMMCCHRHLEMTQAEMAEAQAAKCQAKD